MIEGPNGKEFEEIPTISRQKDQQNIKEPLDIGEIPTFFTQNQEGAVSEQSKKEITPTPVEGEKTAVTEQDKKQIEDSIRTKFSIIDDNRHIPIRLNNVEVIGVGKYKLRIKVSFSQKTTIQSPEQEIRSRVMLILKTDNGFVIEKWQDEGKALMKTETDGLDINGKVKNILEKINNNG